MAIKHTTGTLDASTASTGTMIELTGHANWIYVAVTAQTYGWFSRATGSSGTGTGLGMTLATGDTYVFQFNPGDAVYWWHVATAAETYSIMEVY